MKISILLLYIVNVIFLAKCSEIDLKNHKITGNVNVFHGYYSSYGKYKMFVGDEDPIEKVYYGSQIIYPDENEVVQETKCLLEMFERKEKRFYRMYIIRESPNGTHTFERPNYEEEGDKLVKKRRLNFVGRNSRKMYLNIDVSSDKIHPFIDKTIETLNDKKIIKYKMKNQYYGVNFDGATTITYKFGNAYDSTTPIVVAYKIFDEFMTEFDSVTLYYKNNRLEGSSFHRNAITLNYVKNDSGFRTLWIAIPDNLNDLIDDHKILAQSLMNKPELQLLAPGLLMLDVSEVMAPSLFEIDKTVGTRGSWNYTLYSINNKYKQFFKLAKVVDSIANEPVIYNVKDDAIETVVVKYENKRDIVVLVSSTVPGPEGNNREVNGFVWNVVSGNGLWSKIFSHEIPIYGELLEISLPIQIDILIHDEPTSIYSKKIYDDQNGFYIHFSINEPDDLMIEEGKYVFGKIKDKKLYEKGNFPTDPFKKDVKYLSMNTNSPNIIVTNSTVPRPLSYSDRKKYHTVLIKQD